jgi:hypothetical protein
VKKSPLALRPSSGRTAKYLKRHRYHFFRGEACRTMNEFFHSFRGI